jgi:hypothetical protein
MKTTTRRSLIGTATTVALAGSVLAGCGAAEKLSAAQEVSKAFESIQDSKSLQVGLYIEAEAQHLVDISDDDLTLEDAKKATAVKLVLAMTDPKKLKDLDQNKLPQGVSLKVVQSNKDLGEVRIVDNKWIYGRADLGAVSTLIDEEMPSREEALEEVDPDKQEYAGALYDGKWLGLDGTKVINEMTAKINSAPKPKPKDEDTVKKIWGAVGTAFNNSIEIEEKGKVDGAKHLVVSASAKTIADKLVEQVRPIIKGTEFEEMLRDAEIDIDEIDTKDVPDKKYGVDLYIKGGKLTKFSVDFDQFMDKPSGKPVRLSVDFKHDGVSVEQPKDGVLVKPEDVDKVVEEMKDQDLSEL